MSFEAVAACEYARAIENACGKRGSQTWPKPAGVKRGFEPITPVEKQQLLAGQGRLLMRSSTSLCS